jgi:hypothetical protein
MMLEAQEELSQERSDVGIDDSPKNVPDILKIIIAARSGNPP